MFDKLVSCEVGCTQEFSDIILFGFDIKFASMYRKINGHVLLYFRTINWYCAILLYISLNV